MDVGLISRKAVVRLIVESNAFCHVFLYTANTHSSVYLGVHRVESVCSGLIAGLTRKDPYTGQPEDPNGSGMYWILSLAVRHTAVYGAVTPTGIQLFFEDQHGKLFDSFDLSRKDIRDWVKILSKLRRDWAPRSCVFKRLSTLFQQ